MDRDGQALTVAVILRDTGQHVGEVVLFMNSVEQRTGELGYVFHPEFHGRGFAVEASVELLRLGFEQLGMHRIIARLDARNTGSVNLLKRLRLREGGALVEKEEPKGGGGRENRFSPPPGEGGENAGNF